MKNTAIISVLSPSLFWDINVETLNWDTHAQLIVERVITRGNYFEFKKVEEKYGKEMVGAFVRNIRKLNEKDISFVHIYFGIPLAELKCYTKKQ